LGREEGTSNTILLFVFLCALSIHGILRLHGSVSCLRTLILHSDDKLESMQHSLIASEASEPSPSFILHDRESSDRQHPRKTLGTHTAHARDKSQSRIREKRHDLSVHCGYSRPRPFTSRTPNSSPCSLCIVRSIFPLKNPRWQQKSSQETPFTRRR
jgi:hypothetical protein